MKKEEEKRGKGRKRKRRRWGARRVKKEEEEEEEDKEEDEEKEGETNSMSVCLTSYIWWYLINQGLELFPGVLFIFVWIEICLYWVIVTLAWVMQKPVFATTKPFCLFVSREIIVLGRDWFERGNCWELYKRRHSKLNVSPWLFTTFCLSCFQ